MAKEPVSEESRLSDEELQALMPMVLQLQRLIQDRVGRGLRPREELAVISITSCNNNSCN
jgi:hypothetical protein